MSPPGEVVRHRRGRVGNNILFSHGRGVGGDHDHRVFQRSPVVQDGHDLLERRYRFPDAAVDADDVFALLVENGIERNDRLPGHAIAEDQLSLSLGDRDQDVHDLGPRRQGLIDGAPPRDGRGIAEHRVVIFRLDLDPAVALVPERRDHPAQERLAHRDPERLTHAGNHHAHAEFAGIAEDQGQDIGLIVAHDDPPHVLAHVDNLAVEARGETIDPDDDLLDVLDPALLFNLDLEERNPGTE